MSFLNKIKKSVSVRSFNERKPITSLSKLTQNKNFPITSAKRIQTKFGEQIMLELDDCFVYLPKRCNNQLTDEDIKELPRCCFEVVEPYGQYSFHVDFHLKPQTQQEHQQQQLLPQPPPTPQAAQKNLEEVKLPPAALFFDKDNNLFNSQIFL